MVTKKENIMTTRTRIKWTAEEDAVLRKAVKDNHGNLHQGFEAASHILPHSAKACANRWYTKLKAEENKDSMVFMSISSKGAAVNKKNFSKDQRKKPKKGFRKLWNQFLKSMMI